jgi:hypothetical protein
MLEENSFTGPIVSPIVEKAGVIIGDVKNYCVYETPDTAGAYPKVHAEPEVEDEDISDEDIARI